MPSAKVGIIGSFNPRPRSSLLPPKEDIRTSFRVCLRLPQVQNLPIHASSTISTSPCVFQDLTTLVIALALVGWECLRLPTIQRARLRSKESKSILACTGHQRQVEVTNISLREGNKANNVGERSRSRIEIIRFLACFLVFVITDWRLVCRKPLSFKDEPKQRREGV
jgi:hypothetical protein